MKILDFVKPEQLIADLRGVDKPTILAELGAHLAGQMASAAGVAADATADTLTRILSDRERLASTAIGEGVAIPHGKLASLHKLVGCVARSVKGVDFDSMDGRPTHIFFVLLAPENSTGIHLKALARISRLFKDPEFRSRLMLAHDAAEMYRVVADEDAKY